MLAFCGHFFFGTVFGKLQLKLIFTIMKRLLTLLSLFFSTFAFAQITVYTAANYQGYSKQINSNWSGDLSWVNKISSIKVPSGTKIIVYEQANFQGNFMSIDKNWNIGCGTDTWNDRINSIKFITKTQGFPGNHNHNHNHNKNKTCINLQNHVCNSTCFQVPKGNFSAGYYTSMDAAVSNPLDVKILDLRGQNLSSWNSQIYKLTNLEELYISNNNFSSWPSYFYDLKSLRVLIAENNKFSSFPTYFSSMVNLEIINFSNNPISSFPSSFSNLSKLKELDMSNTKISQLSTYFYQLKALIHINISNTNIGSFPSYFSDLKQLHYMDIRGTKISYIPSSIKSMNIQWQK